jgi:outer membrane protease
MSGDGTYTIGGAVSDNFGGAGGVHWPLSELKWPLDVWMVSVGAAATFKRFSLEGEVRKNVTSDAGSMEDSDWGIYWLETGDPFFRTDTLDIFSTSDADLSALIFDIKGRYWFMRKEKVGLAVGGGWLYQNFDYEANNVDQFSPSARDTYFLPFDPFAFRFAGVGITYEVTYNIPYLELALDWTMSEKFTLLAFVGYSPFAKAEDVDDHILIRKLSEGDCDGSAFLFGLDGRFNITERWFVNAGVDYLNIDTSGTQTQSFYAGELAGLMLKIDQEITASQTYVSLALGFGF